MLVNARLYLNVLWCVYNYYSSYVVGEVIFHFHIVLKDVFGSGYFTIRKLLCVCFNVDSYEPIMYLQFTSVISCWTLTSPRPRPSSLVTLGTLHDGRH